MAASPDRLQRLETLPMWVIGTVNAYGEIRARTDSTSDVHHTPEERLSGRPWRWNCWGQDWGDVREGSAHLSLEDWYIVTKWLEESGYKTEPDEFEENL